jgi:hypothetical protein
MRLRSPRTRWLRDLVTTMGPQRLHGSPGTADSTPGRAPPPYAQRRRGADPSRTTPSVSKWPTNEGAWVAKMTWHRVETERTSSTSSAGSEGCSPSSGPSSCSTGREGTLIGAMARSAPSERWGGPKHSPWSSTQSTLTAASFVSAGGMGSGPSSRAFVGSSPIADADSDHPDSAPGRPHPDGSALASPRPPGSNQLP